LRTETVGQVVHVLACLFHLLGTLEAQAALAGTSHMGSAGRAELLQSESWLDHYGIADVRDLAVGNAPPPPPPPPPVRPRPPPSPSPPPGGMGGDDHAGHAAPPPVTPPAPVPAAIVNPAAVKGGGRTVPTSIKYLYSIYWSVTTVTTIGYGDVTPVTDLEVCFAILAEVIGMFIFVYATNSVSQLMNGLNAKRGG
jgi:hypothetical protein